MSLDLTGIQNDNEFYSHHYLSAIFEGDLKDTFKQWQQQEEDYREALKISQEKPDTSSPERAPWIRLRSLSQVFFKLQNQKEKNTAQFNAQLLQTLNYQPQRALKSLEQAGDIPVIAEVTQGLQPIVWVLQAINKDNEQDDPLTLNLQSQQWPTDAIAEPQLLDLSFEDLISKHIFALDKPPRWIILISDQQLLLIDRIKWHEKRLLRFNLDEIFGSKVVLGHCDIKIVGRSRKLRVNYRTTEQIRHTAMAVLEGIPFDDLDNGIDAQKGYRSLMTGAEPLVQCFKSAQEEIDYLIQSLQSLSNEDLEKA
ncbi:MAG: hypothetical protein GQ532_21350, partial [Methylomarinum sp.]|nr:hypothetical protein [Methylomarinum sp.]